MVGVGGMYDFYYKNSELVKISTHIWGFKAFSDFALVKSLNNVMPVRSNMAIFAEAEYLGLNLENKYFSPAQNESGRFWHHSLLLGLGIRQPINKRSAFFIKYLFDLNYLSTLPYDNPYIEFGFEF